MIREIIHTFLSHSLRQHNASSNRTQTARYRIFDIVQRYKIIISQKTL